MFASAVELRKKMARNYAIVLTGLAIILSAAIGIGCADGQE
jgi:hypothetical protein